MHYYGICLLFLVFHCCATDFKLGLENIPPSLVTHLKQKRIGLVTNQTGKDQKGRSTLEVLQAYGICVQKLLTPEHGLAGTVGAGVAVLNSVDHQSGLSVVSLYGAGTGKVIQEDTIGNLDLLIFDIQDSGMRHYTYISTLFELLKAAARYNKEVVILDRPNPLGLRMEGPLVEPELQSFISIAPIPVRHGMTVGELASFFNVHLLETPASLYVVPMRNYERHQVALVPDSLMLSPNITTKAACHGYSFLGLLGEVRPFHTCRGTDKTLQCLMLPEHMATDAMWKRVEQLLRAHHIESYPYSYRSAGTEKVYKGLHFVIPDINKVSSWNVLLMVLQFFSKHGVPLQFSSAFDKAVGTRYVQALIHGESTLDEVHRTVNKQLEQFYRQARSVFLYAPHPRISLAR